ncbi:hypothetical protein SUGI_0908110 [Cryptomeria japonica]|nr:hypothetical protein SUGI_0908110 [Cryptomeria japonica]
MFRQPSEIDRVSYPQLLLISKLEPDAFICVSKASQQSEEEFVGGRNRLSVRRYSERTKCRPCRAAWHCSEMFLVLAVLIVSEKFDNILKFSGHSAETEMQQIEITRKKMIENIGFKAIVSWGFSGKLG